MKQGLKTLIFTGYLSGSTVNMNWKEKLPYLYQNIDVGSKLKKDNMI